MKDLIERLERAEEGSRELDAMLQILVFEKPDYIFPNPVLNRGPKDWVEACSRMRWDGGGGHYSWPAYTTSLDAAMTLVPEGWQITEMRWVHTHDCWLVAMRDWHKQGSEDAPKVVQVEGKTLALALCIASLKASETDNG